MGAVSHVATTTRGGVGPEEAPDPVKAPELGGISEEKSSDGLSLAPMELYQVYLCDWRTVRDVLGSSSWITLTQFRVRWRAQREVEFDPRKFGCETATGFLFLLTLYGLALVDASDYGVVVLRALPALESFATPDASFLSALQRHVALN